MAFYPNFFPSQAAMAYMEQNSQNSMSSDSGIVSVCSSNGSHYEDVREFAGFSAGGLF